MANNITEHNSTIDKAVEAAQTEATIHAPTNESVHTTVSMVPLSTEDATVSESPMTDSEENKQSDDDESDGEHEENENEDNDDHEGREDKEDKEDEMIANVGKEQLEINEDGAILDISERRNVALQAAREAREAKAKERAEMNKKRLNNLRGRSEEKSESGEGNPMSITDV
jgi:hypothetical protein